MLCPSYRLLREEPFARLADSRVEQAQTLLHAALGHQMFELGEDFVNDNTLTVYIKRLREKLEDDPQNPALIQTVRGLGYKAGD